MGLKDAMQGFRKAKRAGSDLLDTLTYKRNWPETKAEFAGHARALARAIQALDPHVLLPTAAVPEEFDFDYGEDVMKIAEKMIVNGKDPTGTLAKIASRMKEMIKAGIRE